MRFPTLLVCVSKISLAAVALIAVYVLLVTPKYSSNVLIKQEELVLNFSNTDKDNVTGFPYPIVPNIVHMVHFDSLELNFGEMLAIKSVYTNHKPERIIIHCNCHNLSGKYWNLVKDIDVLEVRYKEKPVYIFGRKISWVQHASDVARLQILLQHGGIYIDSDVYVVKSLDKYRHFEFAINWDPGQYIGSQVLICHKNARFLKLYYEQFHDYQPKCWYCNAGEIPTKRYLYRMPYLVHRVTPDFGADTGLVGMLYRQKTDKWKSFSTIHLLLRHKSYMVKDDPVVEFDMQNIRTYNRTFGDMARLVLFGSTEMLPPEK